MRYNLNVSRRGIVMATRKKSAPKKTAYAKPARAKSVKKPRKHQEELLDEALEESFPASDPLPVDPGVVHISDTPKVDVGDRAPDFALKATPDQTISLKQ